MIRSMDEFMRRYLPNEHQRLKEQAENDEREGIHRCQLCETVLAVAVPGEGEKTG